MNTPISIKKAIITGASGPIGKKLLELFAEEGVEACSIANPASRRNSDIEALPNTQTLYCGLEGLKETTPSGQWDAFFHLGWAASENRASRNNVLRQYQNIAWTLDAVALAERAGCKVFVGAGSQAEYGPLPDGIARVDTPAAPVEAYGIAKYAAGRLSAMRCAELGLRQCWGRILSVYGEGDRDTTLIMYVVGCLARGETPRLTACEQIWDYIYSGDCASALWHMALSGKHGTAYPLGSGKARPLKEYMEELRLHIAPQAIIEYGAIPYPEGQIMHMEADMRPMTEDTGFICRGIFHDNLNRIIR